MLVLSRKDGQKVIVGHNVVITVLEIRGDLVKLGFDAPGQIPIHREEVRRRIDHERAERVDVGEEIESPFFAECA
ncbi:MAG TPA: carbon storage regulator [Pirellulales bacterium]|nr:carbon storage regulator [Pirellulales bacterium]